jgi:hypothetical protein
VHNTCIDELGKFINSSEADDLLGDLMKKRYEDLINWQKTGAVKSLLEAEESAKVLLEVIEMRKKITPLLKNAGMTRSCRLFLLPKSTKKTDTLDLVCNQIVLLVGL